MSYSAVPTHNYDQQDISQPAPTFAAPEDTQYSHEKSQILVHQHSDDSIPGIGAFTHGDSNPKNRRGFWKTIRWIFYQIVSFLWIAPIVALLYLNMTGYVMGASAWCPFGHCRPYQYGGTKDTFTQLSRFDHNSHNLLGALQFAAKALEVWFILVASAFVFRITMIMVHMPDGLPLGYLFRPSEYSEVTSLLDRELYTTVLRMPRGSRKHTKKIVAAFVVLTILLCIICNLMGPAVAVLLIPQLQWIETARVGNQTLAGLNSGSPPGLTGFVFTNLSSYCDAETFSAQNYSCANSDMVDGWVQSYASSQSSLTSIFSVQDDLTISYNKTWITFPSYSNETMYFVPNRQVVQDLSNDGDVLVNIDYDVPGADIDGTYTPYTRTVQTFVNRQGPMLGAIANLFADFNNSNHWWTTVGSEQYLRCYSSYNMSNVPLCWTNADVCSVKQGNYTRCIQTGTGWNETSNKNASFTITPPYNQDYDTTNGTFGPSLDVKIYSSAKVAFLPDGTLPTEFSEECLPRNGSVASGTNCDWTAFFATGDEPNVAGHSQQVTTWEFTSQPQNGTADATVTTLAVDFSVWQALTEYSYDPSYYTNPMQAVDTALLLDKDGEFTNNLTVVPVDPAWSLAAFAVDNEGIMPNDRPVAILMSEYIGLLDPSDPEAHRFDNVSDWIEGPTLMPIIQLVSMIDFNTTVVDTKTLDKNDLEHPLLSRWARTSVWAYSTDSRTSKLGLVVAIMGCVVVLAKVILSLINRKDYPSPLGLLIVAMEHRYSGEFHGVEKEKYATLPFKLDPDSTRAGGYKFGKSF